MKKQRIVIMGGAGLLALNWACAIRDEWDVVLGEHQKEIALSGVSTFPFNLENEHELEQQLASLAPDLIVNTVGLTNVDVCEAEPMLARKVNAELAYNIACVSKRLNIRLIHISTDQLFDGRTSFYTEDAPSVPLNEYGRSKFLAETWVLTAYPEALVVRTNFFGWGHSLRQSFSDWLIYSFQRGNALTLFDDVYFTPVLADVLVRAVHSLNAVQCSGIYNVVGEQRLSKHEFAQKIAAWYGFPKELIQCGQLKQSNFKAIRPHDMSLANAKVRLVLGHDVGTVEQFFEELESQDRLGRRVELYAAASMGSGQK